jgi:hypothetical protein
MTLPEQSSRAVAQTREFLVRLTSPYVEGGIKGIRREVRAEALALLRHYPYVKYDEKQGFSDTSGEWTPVAERLPPIGTVVLAWLDTRVVFGLVRGDQWIDTLYGWTIPDGPSHWRPLPSPPEVTT